MATLNTLRTRFGVVLSAVIAFALLAFIFSLKSEMGFSSSDPIIAQMDGRDITASEYSSEYNKIQQLSGVTQVDQQQADMLYSSTWQSLISEYVLQPGFENMGIMLGESERMAIISGEIPTQAMYSAFADPSTGLYDVNTVNNFLMMSKGNAEAEKAWAMVNDQARDERKVSKYMALVMAGVNMNDLEVKSGVEAANKSYTGRWARMDYTTVSDTLVTVTDADIKGYYEANKRAYKRQPTRSISYVTFSIMPSESDMESIYNEVIGMSEEFATTSDLRTFIREHRDGSITDNYYSEAQLPLGEADALLAGEMYGPEQIDNSWRMSRVYDTVMASDTLSIRHIVLSYTDQNLADSLMVALRQGGDFAEAAATYSVYPETAQLGGEIGAVPFAAFSDEFAQALAPASKGDIVSITSGDMIQLVQVYNAGKRVKHYKLASVDTPILPSDATRRATHSAAGEFAVAAKGDVNSFKAAAAEGEINPLSADFSSSSRTIALIPGSSEIARWGHRAEVGDLSEIFKTDDGYVVAMLTNINDSEYTPLSGVATSIRRQLLSSKKFEKMQAEISGSTFDDIAASMGGTVGDFTDVNFGSFYTAGIGVEPAVIGAIATTESAGGVSELIKGNSGAYIFEVTDVVESEEPQTAEAEKLRSETIMQNMSQQLLFGALESIANIKDLRGATL